MGEVYHGPIESGMVIVYKHSRVERKYTRLVLNNTGHKLELLNLDDSREYGRVAWDYVSRMRELIVKVIDDEFGDYLWISDDV